MKSLCIGDLVKIKRDGKLAEVVAVAEDQKAVKLHVRTGERVEDKFYPEFDLKKIGRV
jgi:hypothetical protein